MHYECVYMKRKKWRRSHAYFLHVCFSVCFCVTNELMLTPCWCQPDYNVTCAQLIALRIYYMLHIYHISSRKKKIEREKAKRGFCCFCCCYSYGWKYKKLCGAFKMDLRRLNLCFSCKWSVHLQLATFEYVSVRVDHSNFINT